jgi:hypothetical protein
MLPARGNALLSALLARALASFATFGVYFETFLKKYSVTRTSLAGGALWGSHPVEQVTWRNQPADTESDLLGMPGW